MAILKAFKGLRPPNEIVKDLASRPYDVLNSEEAREEAFDNEYSLLHIIKPEIDLAEEVDLYSPEVYNKAKSNFEKFKKSGWLVEDDDEYLYIYAQTMFGKTQYGIVGCASVEDYMNNVIKKHELTRPDKEEDRMKHVRITNANMEPVFFSYPAVKEIDDIVAAYVKQMKLIMISLLMMVLVIIFGYCVTKRKLDALLNCLKNYPQLMWQTDITGQLQQHWLAMRKPANNPNHNGDEEYNYFLAVHFPDNQLTIIDYNRVVKDLNGYTAGEFLEKLKKGFEVVKKGADIYKPDALHNFSMYLEGKWYSLTAKNDTYNDKDPIGVLDVTILTNQVLAPLLDIQDLRRSKRIDFVGGIRGLGELKKRVDSGEMKVAFALYPVSMKQLIDIADNDMIMPPKTTWFEPKLRSGLVVHELD